MTKQILCIFLTMFAFSFAEKDFDNAKEEFVSEPKSGEEAAKYMTNSEGNVLFGKVPSVEECKSYDGPKLLTEFAWGGDER